MKTIQKDELYQNLKGFLKDKGIDLQDGSYTHRIEQGCGLLADSINVSQRALHRAKSEVGKGLERVRQVIHEQTAPQPPVPEAPPASAPAPAAKKEKVKKPAGGKSKKRPRAAGQKK